MFPKAVLCFCAAPLIVLPEKTAMYAFLMMAMTLLGGIVRLAQALRLSVPLLYGALVITVFRPWYLTHTALADGIFFVLVGLVALSWVVSLIRVVREMVV